MNTYLTLIGCFGTNKPGKMGTVCQIGEKSPILTSLDISCEAKICTENPPHTLLADVMKMDSIHRNHVLSSVLDINSASEAILKS